MRMTRDEKRENEWYLIGRSGLMLAVPRIQRDVTRKGGGSNPLASEGLRCDDAGLVWREVRETFSGNSAYARKRLTSQKNSRFTVGGNSALLVGANIKLLSQFNAQFYLLTLFFAQ